MTVPTSKLLDFEISYHKKWNPYAILHRNLQKISTQESYFTSFFGVDVSHRLIVDSKIISILIVKHT